MTIPSYHHSKPNLDPSAQTQRHSATKQQQSAEDQKHPHQESLSQFHWQSTLARMNGRCLDPFSIGHTSHQCKKSIHQHQLVCWRCSCCRSPLKQLFSIWKELPSACGWRQVVSRSCSLGGFVLRSFGRVSCLRWDLIVLPTMQYLSW